MTGDPRLRLAHLAWMRGLEQALHAVSAARGLTADELDFQTECEVSASLAAALLAFAASAQDSGLTWAEAARFARDEQFDIHRCQVRAGL